MPYPVSAVRGQNFGVSDTTAPTITITSSESSPTAASPIPIAFALSAVSTDFAADDVTVAHASLSNFAGSGTSYTCSLTPDGTGTVMVDIAAGAFHDAAGTANLAATQFAIAVTFGVTLQPDATAGVDAYVYAGAATNNYGTHTLFSVGHDGAAAARGFIKFNLTGIPSGSTVSSAVFSIRQGSEASSNDRTMRIYRLKRAWVEGTRAGVNDNPATGITWNRYDTTNNWQTAGGFGVDDCEQTDIGSRAFSATEASAQWKDFTLDASKVTEMIPGGSFTNNGFLVKVDTENTDMYVFASSDNATAANRPKLILTYTTPLP